MEVIYNGPNNTFLRKDDDGNITDVTPDNYVEDIKKRNKEDAERMLNGKYIGTDKDGGKPHIIDPDKPWKSVPMPKEDKVPEKAPESKEEK